MKVIKPLELGVLPRAYRMGGNAYMDIGILLFFELGRDAAAPMVISEPKGWPEALACLPARSVLDLGLHKLTGEVLVAGAAHTHSSTTGVDVRVALGEIDKRVRVTRDDRPAVAPGPFAQLLPETLDAPGRTKRLGSYDRRWMAQGAWGYAEDIDWSVFNLAPPDQQLKGRMFQGGEHYRIEQMHPECAVLAGGVPSLRARCFLNMKDGALRTPEAYADTLWLFPNAKLGALVWHASCSVEDDEGADVKTLMVAYERHEQPRSEEHYRKVLALRSDPKTAAAHAFHAGQLGPAELAAGGDADAHRIRASANLGEGSVDLTATLEGGAARAEAVARDGERARAQQRAAARPADADAVVKSAVTAALQRLDTSLQARARRVPGASHPPSHGGHAAPPAAAADAVGTALAQRVQALLHEGTPLAQLDLTGVHLRGLDLTEHDLRGVSFDHAVLEDVRLSGATLSGTSFAQARLLRVRADGADLQEARLKGTELQDVVLTDARLQNSQWSKALATRCRFERTDWGHAKLAQSQLIDCRFHEARFDTVAWLQCVLSRCEFAEAHFVRGSWLQCELQACDMRGVHMRRLALLSPQAAGLVLEGAKLERVLFGSRAALQGARARGLVAHHCGFRDANLDGADLSQGTLVACDLASTSLRSARLDGALVSSSVLRLADLTGADLREVDLYQSVLTKAIVEDADLSNARMLDVERRAASFRGARVRGVDPKLEVST